MALPPKSPEPTAVGAFCSRGRGGERDESSSTLSKGLISRALNVVVPGNRENMNQIFAPPLATIVWGDYIQLAVLGLQRCKGRC